MPVTRVISGPLCLSFYSMRRERERESGREEEIERGMIRYNIFFPQGLEVKSVSSESPDKSILSVIKQAARQTAVRNQLLGRWHADILGLGWTFQRAVAVPLVASLAELPICASCRPHVLDQLSIRDDLKGWLTGTKKVTCPLDHQYKNLLTRFLLLTNLYTFSKKP